ncbi:NH(3)-dependent NAD(+) synthetase [Streptomyces sp. NBRC 110611]|uniref:ammonia-dependent NAD(+) synthetase n=1 Tax=Streptomyces sp. NBRC 110611 TaxID=1621259 RepID=UPI000832ED27|nr:ammonia-dependent NAD(+) synthetase [Streptomyces sp. NBRC 110611]GAU65557.1 NH(3)-dependent NAD(+) synthetase [Streptomyces sp. NBRC 110611]
MTDPASKALQQEIARDLQVTASFDAEREIERRVAFLTERLTSTGLRSLVLGISGGVDSTTTGRLCQLAVERARAAGHEATFYAMRLPYGVQADEKDAQRALEFIRADQELTVDIRPASDAALEAVVDGGLVFRDAHHQDFVHGNIKARQRMIAQYAVAGAQDGLVVGTDHAAEAVSGFFTKFGDGAADVVPLTGLTKRRVRAVAAALGAPEELVTKVPTADLETLDPGKPDEDALGVSYDQIDDFLEGEPVPPDAFRAIARRYRLTEHKRALPIAP